MHKLLASTLALSLTLAGAALAESMTGTVDSVDPTTRTVVINGQPYIIEGQAAGLKIDQIQPGQKVTIEYDVNTNDVSQIDLAK